MKKRTTPAQAMNRLMIERGMTTLREQVSEWFKMNRDCFFRQMGGDDMDAIIKERKRFEVWCERHGYKKEAAKQELIMEIVDFIDFAIEGPKWSAANQRRREVLAALSKRKRK